MNTDDLIATLALRPAPPPLRAGWLGLELLAAIAGSAALFLAVAGSRAGLPGLWENPLIAAKTLWPAISCLVALPMLLALLRPEGRIAHPARLGLLPALAAALWIAGFAGRAPAARFAEFAALPIVECVGLILVIATVPLWLALRLAARGAPTRPALTGAMAGLVAGTGAAAGYSFFCLQDNPLFYVTWYGTATLLSMAAGAWAGARRLRW